MTDKEKQAVISSLKTMKKHEKIGACATCAKAAGFALELIDEYERASRYKLQYEASIVDNGRARDPLEKKIYGSYVSLPVDPEESDGGQEMSKKDGRYWEFLGIADQDKENLIELVPACIWELMDHLLAMAKKDKNVPDMSTLVIKIVDWKNMGKTLERCNEFEFKELLIQQKSVKDTGARYTVGMRFESLSK